MKLRVNLIVTRHFYNAGEEIPPHVKIPLWCIREHRCGDIEAAQIVQRREELRAQAAERREKAEAKKAAKKAAGAKQSA
jgi:hypothetical protein